MINNISGKWGTSVTFQHSNKTFSTSVKRGSKATYEWGLNVNVEWGLA